MASTTLSKQETLDIWQWNCRGYRKKQGLLQQYIHTQQTPPDIISLQETGTTPTLAGYTCYETQEKGRTATLVSKALIAISHDRIADTDVEHVIVEIIPKKKRKRGSIFIVNAYSPRNRGRQNSTSFSMAHAN